MMTMVLVGAFTLLYMIFVSVTVVLIAAGGLVGLLGALVGLLQDLAAAVRGRRALEPGATR